MGAARIVLTGMGSKLAGLRWEFDDTVRIGRQASADIVLRDYSVDRLHAELRNCGSRWVVRDLANSHLHPTLVNGVLLAGGQRQVHEQDVLQVGEVMIQITAASHAPAEDAPSPSRRILESTPLVAPFVRSAASPGRLLIRPQDSAAASSAGAMGESLRTSATQMQVQLATRHSWDQALQHVANQHRPEQARAILTLLRANHHLGEFFTLQEMLLAILTDAMAALAAQRGAILLSEPGREELTVRVVSTPHLVQTDKGYSKILAQRCFESGESILCHDVQSDEDLLAGRRIKLAGMASVICALLRTPRRRLGVLHLDRGPLQEPFAEHELQLADAIAASVAVGIDAAQMVEQERSQLMETMSTLVRAVEMRDQYTGGHSQRVADYALLVAEEMRVPSAERYQIQLGTLLYDIGKIGINEAILQKPGKLSPAEFDIMKAHTVKGAGILGGVGSLQRVIPIVRHHHERWDGSGYPDGIGRDHIALPARIVAVADAFDAMTSHRPYRPALSTERAFLEILTKAGTHFDPACVHAFLRTRKRVETLLQQSEPPNSQAGV